MGTGMAKDLWSPGMPSEVNAKAPTSRSLDRLNSDRGVEGELHERGMVVENNLVRFDGARERVNIQWKKVVKPIALLVPVSSTCCHAYTASLSTW